MAKKRPAAMLSVDGAELSRVANLLSYFQAEFDPDADPRWAEQGGPLLEMLLADGHVLVRSAFSENDKSEDGVSRPFRAIASVAAKSPRGKAPQMAVCVKVPAYDLMNMLRSTPDDVGAAGFVGRVHLRLLPNRGILPAHEGSNVLEIALAHDGIRETRHVPVRSITPARASTFKDFALPVVGGNGTDLDVNALLEAGLSSRDEDGVLVQPPIDFTDEAKGQRSTRGYLVGGSENHVLFARCADKRTPPLDSDYEPSLDPAADAFVLSPRMAHAAAILHAAAVKQCKDEATAENAYRQTSVLLAGAAAALDQTAAARKKVPEFERSDVVRGRLESLGAAGLKAAWTAKPESRLAGAAGAAFVKTLPSALTDTDLSRLVMLSEAWCAKQSDSFRADLHGQEEWMKTTFFDGDAVRSHLAAVRHTIQSLPAGQRDAASAEFMATLAYAFGEALLRQKIAQMWHKGQGDASHAGDNTDSYQAMCSLGALVPGKNAFRDLVEAVVAEAARTTAAQSWGSRVLRYLKKYSDEETREAFRLELESATAPDATKLYLKNLASDPSTAWIERHKASARGHFSVDSTGRVYLSVPGVTISDRAYRPDPLAFRLREAAEQQIFEALDPERVETLTRNRVEDEHRAWAEDIWSIEVPAKDLMAAVARFGIAQGLGGSGLLCVGRWTPNEAKDKWSSRKVDSQTSPLQFEGTIQIYDTSITIEKNDTLRDIKSKLSTWAGCGTTIEEDAYDGSFRLLITPSTAREHRGKPLTITTKPESLTRQLGLTPFRFPKAGRLAGVPMVDHTRSEDGTQLPGLSEADESGAQDGVLRLVGGSLGKYRQVSVPILRLKTNVEHPSAFGFSAANVYDLLAFPAGGGSKLTLSLKPKGMISVRSERRSILIEPVNMAAVTDADRTLVESLASYAPATHTAVAGDVSAARAAFADLCRLAPPRYQVPGMRSAGAFVTIGDLRTGPAVGDLFAEMEKVGAGSTESPDIKGARKRKRKRKLRNRVDYIGEEEEAPVHRPVETQADIFTDLGASEPKQQGKGKVSRSIKQK